MNQHTILVTGGAGYIGSHACVELLQSGYKVVVIDNFSNSHPESLVRVQQIAAKPLSSYDADIRDLETMESIFSKEGINTVMHFAGLKAVSESCELPVKYYSNNVAGTLVLLEAMAKARVKNLIFSSSATVYDGTKNCQYQEDSPLGAVNTYGKTKAMVEDILRDVVQADWLNHHPNPWKIILLRYFNPIGAHESGLIGENPNGIPNNLMPYITQVAIGKLAELSVFGNDYPTPDGTAIRDYIHVVDLVKGHIKAITALTGELFKDGACKAYNLGTGRGYSVLEIIHAFEKILGHPLNFKIAPRREGDIAEYFANPDLALTELNWQAEKTLLDMVTDSWRWQQKNPNGYHNF